MELRRAGHLIDASRVTTVDSDGFSHSGVALYSMGETEQEHIYQGPAVVIGVGYGSTGSYLTAQTKPQ